ncbi:DNA-binding transcriptional regulator DicC [Aeromonas rivipollensis]|uniref:Cro/CI family transcriptional regulator n=1 Tax=Aeromonas TaxID=642 RepID=UPI0034A4F2E4
MKKLDVIAYFGGVTKTAKALGISKSAVSLWGEDIPYGRACQIQLLTKGKLKTEQVRPS